MKDGYYSMSNAMKEAGLDPDASSIGDAEVADAIKQWIEKQQGTLFLARVWAAEFHWELSRSPLEMSSLTETCIEERRRSFLRRQDSVMTPNWQSSLASRTLAT